MFSNNLNDNVEVSSKKFNIIKIFIIFIIIFLLAFISLILFNKSRVSYELNWNDEYSDYKYNYINPSNVKLGINFTGPLDEINYSTTCGEVSINGLEINWNLTEATDKCKIIVSYKSMEISKEYTIVDLDYDAELYLEYEIDLDSDEDLDLDGLTNKQEKEYGTNPLISDSDLDGLDDKYEISISKTNPNKKDSDDDDLSDYDEIELGYNPLLSDSKGDGIKDGDRTSTYDFISNDVNISITGSGNIASTVVFVNSDTKISSKQGLIDNLYTFYTEGDMDSSLVTIKYTDEDLLKYGLDENNLSIYYYNEENNEYEKVESSVDVTNNTVSATLNHFSNYVIGDSTLVKQSTSTEILLILDNSWSMYSNEQYEQITGKKYFGGLFNPEDLPGYDKDGVRFTLTGELIDKLSKKNFKIGLSEFRRDYKNAVKIGNDINSLKSALNTMNGKFITNYEGTDIVGALTESIGDFSKEDSNKYIIILTDGDDIYLKSSASRIIEKATKNGIKICSIGFGDATLNTNLANISNATGCEFYSSSDVGGLTELFENMETFLNDDLIDINEDDKMDGIVIADSGFIVNRDGFSFDNYGSNLAGGHCYGMATFAQLYYKKVLPLLMDAKTVDDVTSYSYDLTDTYFKNYSSLYDYKLKTNDLKYLFNFELFGEEEPERYRSLEDNVSVINDEYKEKIMNSGIFDIVKVDVSDKDYAYDFIEVVFLNEDKIQDSHLSDEEVELFNAIYASFIRQKGTIHYASGTNFVFWLADVMKVEAVDYKGASGFINILKTRLNDKDPLVIATMSHAVNAISLVQDIENPNHYYIGVYDNNYPGEKRYYDIECKKGVCKTVDNEYYENGGEALRITPSLEYDLEYYNSDVSR